MKEAERIVSLVAAAIAKAAENCADDLENRKSDLNAPEALRNFAAAIRQTNQEYNDVIQSTFH